MISKNYKVVATGKLALVLSTLFIFSQSCRRIPKEYEAVCEYYKVYHYSNGDYYIFKKRDREIGAYVVFVNNDRYYSKRRVEDNGGTFYVGRDYDSPLKALLAMELGVAAKSDMMPVDDNLDLQFDTGTKSYDIRNNCEVICN